MLAVPRLEGFWWDTRDRDAAADLIDPTRTEPAAEPAVVEPPADRAAVRAEAFDEAAEMLAKLDPVKAALAGQHAWADAAGLVRHMAVQERRMADEPQPAAADTLPAWLYQRFMPAGVGWDQLDDDQRSYWEHQARAVRRAVARGGFKQPAAGARQDGATS
ncbi:hypothetical protein ACFYOV_32895 [Streptomyces sp. NPDC005931]|uniref:hypothetical protein n=1 Tax=Streptomyces sp. NPDC005931 TaxID=3364737 RepID=UPI0036BBEE26